MWHLHRAERADTLARALGELLAEPLADPFAAEVVAVPAKGVERWLAQRLSHRLGAAGAAGDGVCAGVAFPSPAAVVAEAVAAATGAEPRRRPLAAGAGGVAAAGGDRRERSASRGAPRWAPTSATRGAAAGTPSRATSPSCSPPTPRTGRSCSRLAAAVPERRTAAPPTSRGSPSCGGGCASASAPRPRPSGSTRRALRCAPTRTWRTLPARVSLFGPTRLPAEHLAVLAALAEHRDVHLWLPHPSPALWAAVGAPPRRSRTAAPIPPPTRRATRCCARSAATSASCSCGSPPRPRSASTSTIRRRTARRPRCSSGCRPTCATTARPTAASRMRADDRSVQVHACHGPDRQVEVLREVVLGLLRADPTLEPRDVLVMCPDVETFAPLVSACFGLRRRPRRRTRASAWRSGWPTARCARSTRCSTWWRSCWSSPTPGSPPRRCSTCSATAPVRRRFDLDDDDLERRARAGRSAPGCGGASTARTGRRSSLDGFPQNTWPPGLDRLLLGVAMSGAEHEWLGTALPLDDVESGDVDRVGRLAEFVDRLAAVLAGLSGEQPLERWVAVLVGRPRRAHPGHRHRRLAGRAGAGRARRGRPRGRAARRHRRARAGRRPRPARRAAARPPHPGQLPHRHPHRRHAGADAVGAAPGGLPARARRRRVPPRGRARRRRRARPRPARRRARPAQRGPPAVPRRDLRRHRAPRRGVLRRRRAHRRPAAAGRAARRAARRRRGHRGPGRPGTRSSCATRCSRSTPRNFTGVPHPFSFDRAELAGRGRGGRAEGAARAVPRRAAAARRRGRGSRSTTWSRSSSTR